MSPLYHALASEVAGKVVMMAFVVPVSVGLAIVLRPELVATPTQIVLFFVALSGAWLLRFFWGLWLACFAFWATRADALLALQDALIFMLAGVVAPVALLPGALHSLARLLPFYYMVGFPVVVLTGQIESTELLTGFVVQAVWLIAAVLIYRAVWRSGVKKGRLTSSSLNKSIFYVR